MSSAAVSVPPRPNHPTPEATARAIHLRARAQILRDDFDTLAEDWILATQGEAGRVQGPPDTSLNPLAATSWQLATPGLYGTPPEVAYPPALDGLLGPTGTLVRAGLWTQGQPLNFYAVGAGIWFRRWSTIRHRDPSVPGGYRVEPVSTLVDPGDVHVETHPGDPRRIARLWHLQLRVKAGGGLVWTWTRYQIYDPATGEISPRLDVVAAVADGGAGEDLSGDYLALADGTPAPGPLAGDAYPWRDLDGATPILPWVVYRALDVAFWPDLWKRSAHKGTLRACAYWTYTGRSALHATGEHTLVAGVDPSALPGSTVRGDRRQDASAEEYRSMPVFPGQITFLPVAEGANLQTVTIAAGVNLPNLLAFARAFQDLLAAQDGIEKTSTTETANPTSAAALSISNASRREFSRQIEPLFGPADLLSIRVGAAVVQSAGGGPYRAADLDAVKVRYRTIPLTPQEQAEIRAQTDWEEDKGVRSQIGTARLLHPGMDRAAAIAHVVQVAIDEAEIEAAIDEALAARGLTRRKPPPPPPLDDPEDGPEDEEDPEADPAGDEPEDAPEGDEDEDPEP